MRNCCARVKRCAQDERQAAAELIATLAELDTRRLYLGEGCSSLFTYCTQVLRLSEHAAYGRIEAARAARRSPLILERLRDGSITLTAVGLLGPHLTDENHREVLDRARHRTKRDVEEIVAILRPKPDAPSAVRKLPTPKTLQAAGPVAGARLTSSEESHPDSCSLPPSAPLVKPLAPERFKAQFTVSRGTHLRPSNARSGGAMADGARSCMNFACERGQLVLWNYYTDPDLWEFVEYSRVEGGGL